MTAPHTSPSGLNGKILVIDDELDIREGLFDLLTLEGGYTVELAHNGTEGLRKLDGTAYDLVLLDLMMPDMSGMDVLRLVRKTDTETPIFMITAYGSVEAAVDALKLGANDYFSKPWDNEKLIIEIDRMILGGSNMRTPTSSAPSSSATASPTSSARASAWCGCWIWWDRWRPAGLRF